MKKTNKSIKLYADLKESILLREYKMGCILPRETELARKYNISRGTLRLALTKLEEEQLVKRVRGKGTFVTSGKIRPKITFLLPCSRSVCHLSFYLLDVFQGVLDMAHQLDCQVETIAISPSNNPADIDWTKLTRIDHNSKVIVIGLWFSRIFSFLKNSGCRAVVVHGGTFQKEKHEKELKNWIVFEKDSWQNAWDLISELWNCGCRSPVYYSKYVEEQEQPRTKAIKEFMKKNGLDPSSRCIALPSGQYDYYSMGPFLEKTLRNSDFDCCLMEYPGLIRAALKIRPDVRYALFDCQQLVGLEPFPDTMISSGFMLPELGREAVKALIAEDYAPVYRKFQSVMCDNYGKPVL